ncbi:hypothetical protein Q9189_000946 [Teloschistes chrysophthalmus]
MSLGNLELLFEQLRRPANIWKIGLIDGNVATYQSFYTRICAFVDNDAMYPTE